ncbi:MAG TPA: LURP-one-related family protein, partial [Nocardioidaceae bacterium]
MEPVHYKMRQRLVSVGDDFWIETDRGERAFKVDGKALRLRTTLVLEDAHGHKLATIQERMMRIKDAMEIEDADG